MSIIKKHLTILLMIAILIIAVGCGNSSTPTSKIPKPETQYTIINSDIPKTDPSAWAPGSKRQVTYTIQVNNAATEEQIKKIGEYVLETDAKPLKNWNVAHFKFVSTENPAAFALGTFTKNGKVADGNQVKPGNFDEFIWYWQFLRKSN